MRKKNLLILGVIVAFIAASFGVMSIQSPQQYQDNANAKVQAVQNENVKKTADGKVIKDKNGNPIVENKQETKQNTSNTNAQQSNANAKQETVKSDNENQAAVAESKQQNKASNKKKAANKNESNTKIVYLYIDVSILNSKAWKTKVPNELKKYIPKNGMVLQKTGFEVSQDATAFDVLKEATRMYRIPMEYQGANGNVYNSVYIEGINNLYEKAVGSNSGWKYAINGHYPNYGMDNPKVNIKNNDTIAMKYVTELNQ